MSSIEAGVGVGSASARAAVKAPTWVWFAIVGGVVGLVVLYTRANDNEVPDYLDPHQPPINALPDYSTSLLGQYATAVGAPAAGLRKPCCFPFNRLMDDPGCWVGDC